MRESRIHSANPRVDSSLAHVDFLPAADQTDNDSPIFMPIHARNEKLWLGLGKPGYSFLTPHKVRGLLQIPGPLRLVENGDMLNRRPGVLQKVITEMMDVLDEGFNTLGGLAFPHSNSAILLTRHLIARECFAQDGYKRPVP